jgi:hypothetical protein
MRERGHPREDGTQAEQHDEGAIRSSVLARFS